MREFFHSVDKLKPAYDKAYQFVMFVCKMLLVADILITCMSVVGRYVSFIPDPHGQKKLFLPACPIWLFFLQLWLSGAMPISV